MAMTDLALIVLLGTALVFAIIELGLSAWIVSVVRNINYFDGDGYRTIHQHSPSQVNFLLFDSIWTILVVIALFVIPIVSRGNWLGFFTLAINFVTMIFWLAGFGALADLYGAPPVGGLAALLAFAILLWLIFLAILIINFLTAFGVLGSNRAGHHVMFKKGGRVTGGNTMAQV